MSYLSLARQTLDDLRKGSGMCPEPPPQPTEKREKSEISEESRLVSPSSTPSSWAYILALAIRRWARIPEKWERVAAIVQDGPEAVREWAQACLAYNQMRVRALDAVDLLEKIVALERAVPATLARSSEAFSSLAELVADDLEPLRALIDSLPVASQAPVAEALWRWEAMFRRPRLVLNNGTRVDDLEAHLGSYPDDASLAFRLLPLTDAERWGRTHPLQEAWD